jgi:hypothetical protein
MATCVICDKDYAVAAPVILPSCPNCGFNGNRPDDSIKLVAAKIGQIGTTRLTSEPIATNIVLRVGTDSLAQNRAKRMLRIVLALHSGAEMIANMVFETPAANRRSRILAVDNALRAQDPEGQEILSNLNHATFSADRVRLMKHCSQGWDTVKMKWGTLTDDYKQHFIDEVFMHDKGYPQTLQSVLNYVKPDDQSMDLVLINILQGPTGTDPYSGIGSTKTDVTMGQRIRDGWSGAALDKKATMWVLLMTRIANEMGINLQQDDAINKIVAELTANRQDVVEQLSNFVPQDAARDFVDHSAKDSWEMIMG